MNKQTNKIENLEIDQSAHRNLTYNKYSITNRWGKLVLNKWFEDN